MVMTAHIVYPQVEKGTYISAETGESIHLPATLSKVILTDILRGDMGFTGLIVTDAMKMDAIARHFNALDAAKLAIEAGVDLILRPVETNTLEGLAALDQYVQDVAALADQGTISMEAVDAAVLRVLDFKEKHGLLTPYASGNEEERIQKALETVGSPAHHETEWEISRKAVTLIKNENVLPLNLSESAAVLVPSAGQVKSAEYAVARLKQEGILADEATIPVYHQSSLTVAELIKLAQNTKHLIAVSASYSAAGMNPATKNGADTAVLDLVIDLAHAAGNDVSVISAQLPYDAAHYTKADAIIVSYGARGMNEDPRDAKGSVSQYGPNVPAAIYNILSGLPMEGRLPIDLPALNENGQFAEEILYPHGFGIVSE
jgi:beta-N-acetylhexosaminidase